MERNSACPHKIHSEWAYHEAKGSDRFAARYSDLCDDLLEKIQNGTSAEDLTNDELSELLELHRRHNSNLVDALYRHKEYQCEPMYRSDFDSLIVLPGLAKTQTQVQFFEWETGERRKRPNGEPHIKDPRVKLDNQDPDETLPFDVPPIIIAHINGNFSVIDGYGRTLLFRNRKQPETIWAWMPTEAVPIFRDKA